MHRYPNYQWLRGFNMVPSWGATIDEAWLFYDGAAFRKEAALASSVHANCLRLWIEFAPWMARPEEVQGAFMDAVVAIDELGMKTMPCLFNRWHDRTWDYGGTYLEHLRMDLSSRAEYVRALVEPLAQNERILAWDLCNEPQASDPESQVAWEEYRWLEAMTTAARDAGALQPLTVGTHQAGKNMEIFAPLCDVLCCHPYGKTAEELNLQLDYCHQVQEQFGKPMMSNETVPGSLDDGLRADCARWTIQKMEAAGFGWMGWGMREGKAVSTRRDRFDNNGLDGQGFHSWFNADGTLRAGLDFLLEPPRYLAPWNS